MDKEKLKKLFFGVKTTVSDVITSAVVFGATYLLFHAIYTDMSRDEKRIKGSSITVTSKGHEYIIFETDRGYTCCIHSAACPCQVNNQKSAPVPSDSIAGPRKSNR